jgi:hypothetical protein
MNRKLEPEAVYLPHNEPYLGRPLLLEFDLAIPGAMDQNTTIAAITFETEMSELQATIAEVVPQGISIALSVRELIRQSYLFSATILLRPLLERTALAFYLIDTPAAVTAWHSGWARSEQPSLTTLLENLLNRWGTPGSSDSKDLATMLHKVVHSDPMAAHWNLTSKNGRIAYSSGKLVDAPEVADFCAGFGLRCLQHLIVAAQTAFPKST